VPEFEIDAQCVNWAQYAEFAEDRGYDRRECWSEAGWAWLQRDGRRAPRDVEQLAGSVLVSRAGQLQRAPLQQPAMQVTRHEAEAWCRWAGRRLPTEPEWELAALSAARRGFAWGDVLEWVAGSARAYPGAEARVPPGTLDVIAAPIRSDGVTAAVLRGCTSATPARWRHAKARRFALPYDDRQRSGFRSCAP
jgi:formylglycine-generating enzyme required for sulfatase activity